jgi:lysylphosphatidylglycerol synthetase-like protein (DUF2156 family)
LLFQDALNLAFKLFLLTPFKKLNAAPKSMLALKSVDITSSRFFCKLPNVHLCGNWPKGKVAKQTKRRYIFARISLICIWVLIIVKHFKYYCFVLISFLFFKFSAFDIKIFFMSSEQYLHSSPQRFVAIFANFLDKPNPHFEADLDAI